MVQRWKKVKLTNNLVGRVGEERLNCQRCGGSLLKEEKVTRHLKGTGVYLRAVYYHNECAKALWF